MIGKGLEALKEIAIQSVEALIGKQEPLRTQKINELLETKQFKCIEKSLKALEIIREKKFIHNDILVAVGKDKEEYDLLKEILL